jgi:hypothetical protein
MPIPADAVAGRSSRFRLPGELGFADVDCDAVTRWRTGAGIFAAVERLLKLLMELRLEKHRELAARRKVVKEIPNL